MFNPFSDASKALPNLMNIYTGKTASKETEAYLCNALSDGEKLRKNFSEECSNNPMRFMKVFLAILQKVT